MKAKISPTVAVVVILLAVGIVLVVWFQLTRTPPMPQSIQEIQGIDAMKATALKSAEEGLKKTGGTAPASQSGEKEATGDDGDNRSPSKGTSAP